MEWSVIQPTSHFCPSPLGTVTLHWKVLKHVVEVDGLIPRGLYVNRECTITSSDGVSAPADSPYASSYALTLRFAF
ncbi:hypothetical protein NHX12_023684 [Muraenolepis orangiensis]|uniref:Uncharacterized protein n=1 Tax=Muraenolepis orangiensis TaxID=630683 RepID=A0A9Q0ISY8_9TELE|nr:hypothetical protein NHX12_023684 [Muraenolepis orangiensis]